METDRLNSGINALQIIRSEFPAITMQGKPASPVKELFTAVNNLTQYTRAQLLTNNELEIEHCYKVAHTIMQQGTNLSRLAIENIFVYGVSHLLEVSFSASQQARNKFLAFFEKEYCRQIYASHT